MSKPLKFALVVGTVNLLISVAFPSVSCYFINFPFFLIYMYAVDMYTPISLFIVSIIGAFFYAGFVYLIGRIIQKDLEYLEKYGVQKK